MQKSTENRTDFHTFEPNNKNQIQKIGIDHPLYPALLKEIHDPPEEIYLRGNQDVLNNPDNFNLAIVGSRKISAYGQMATEFIISGLEGMPINIISGLAYGVDACAHECALSSKLKTIAVLGSGIDDESIYPKENRQLAKKIIEQGGIIISEFPPETKARKQYFPMRNRIISGLSKATAIIEADYKSGALITAKFALEQNRDVFAVPGPINSSAYRGTNHLIHKGAKLLRFADDIINEYAELRRKEPQKQKHLNLNCEQRKIVEIIISKTNSAGCSFEEILEYSELSAEKLNAQISILILRGTIRVLNNNCYVLNLTNAGNAR